MDALADAGDCGNDACGRGHHPPSALDLQAPLLELPPLHWQTLRQLLPAAVAVALLGLINAVSIARAIAARSGQRIDGNQEFFGQGLGNLIGSCCSCYVISGSFNRSGVNYDSGAQTPLSQVVTAVLVAAALIAFLSTLLFSLDFAIYVGVILSLVLYLQKIAHPMLGGVDFEPLHRKARETDPACTPPLRVVRLDGSIFFGSVEHVRSRLAELAGEHEGRSLIILAEGLNRLDIAGLELLLDERKSLQQNGGDLYIIGMKPYLRRKLQHSPYWEMLGGETHLFESTYVACREICIALGIRNYRAYMKYLFRDYNKL